MEKDIKQSRTDEIEAIKDLINKVDPDKKIYSKTYELINQLKEKNSVKKENTE